MSRTTDIQNDSQTERQEKETHNKYKNRKDTKEYKFDKSKKIEFCHLPRLRLLMSAAAVHSPGVRSS